MRSRFSFGLVSGALLFLVSLAGCNGTVSHHGESGGSGGEGGSGGQGGSGGSGGSGGAAPACEAPDPAPEFAVGTGEKCFEALAEGGEVPLVTGPQGGYHVWLAIGCEDCDSPAHLKYGAHDPETGMPLDGTYDGEVMAPLAGAEWPQAAGYIVNMPGLSWDVENQPPPAKGTPIVLWADVLGEGGEVLHHAEVDVLIGDIVEWNPCIDDPNNPLCQTG